MIPFLLKMTICAGLLLAVYILFFEKERMHSIKRFYLLFSLIFAITVPLITVEVPQALILFPEAADAGEVDATIPIQQLETLQTEQIVFSPAVTTPAEAHSMVNTEDVALLIYLTVSGILLIRYLVNISRLFIITRRNKVLRFSNASIVLVDEEVVPHSFLGYIFVNKEEYENGMIENEVVTHEMTHVRQKHSADILFIELLLIVFWFNPILFMYRNKMKQNHEFLADEGVINRFENIPQYQLLLVAKAARKNNLSLTSDLNYSLTKKRLIMMTKITSTRIALLKKAALLPLFLLFAFTFCTKKASEEKKADGQDSKIESTAANNEDNSNATEVVKVEEAGQETPQSTLIVKDDDKTPPPPPPIIVKDESRTPPPPPPMKQTVKFTPPATKKIVRDEDIDLSKYNVHDTITMSNGSKWVLESKDPVKMRTTAPKLQNPPTPPAIKKPVKDEADLYEKKDEADLYEKKEKDTSQAETRLDKPYKDSKVVTAHDGKSNVSITDLQFVKTEGNRNYYHLKDNPKIRFAADIEKVVKDGKTTQVIKSGPYLLLDESVAELTRNKTAVKL